jgi:cytochrome c-type biogenesis protein CcmH
LTTLILACVGLVLLSSLFFLLRPMRPGATEEDLDQANLEWFRRRQAELLEESDTVLAEDARLRLLEDEHLRTESQSAPTQSFPAWVLLPMLALLASALYYLLGAAPDVMIAGQLQGMRPDMPPQAMRELIQAVEERSEQRPENLHYLALLGRYYIGQEDYKRAATTYDALIDEIPADAQALANSAQAEYLAADRTLTARARLRAEQALAVDPHQRTALGLLGMASFEQQQYRAAIDYWQRLLVLEQVDSESAQMIAGVIEAAREQLAAQDPATADSGAETAPGEPEVASVGISVHVPVPPGVEIAATDTVFVLARNADANSRMPIAVQRLTGAQLPVTLRLDDSNSMAGQKLSQTPSVIVAVQVSPEGRPGESNARWLGQIGPVSPALEKEPLEIQLRLNDNWANSPR